MFLTSAVLVNACPFIVYPYVNVPFSSNVCSLFPLLFVICISAFVCIVATIFLFVISVSEYFISTGLFAKYSSIENSLLLVFPSFPVLLFDEPLLFSESLFPVLLLFVISFPVLLLSELLLSVLLSSSIGFVILIFPKTYHLSSVPPVFPNKYAG